MRFFALLLFLLPAWSALAQNQGWMDTTPMPTAREKLATCMIGNNIYAIGGSPGENGSPYSTVERLNTNNGNWAAAPAMTTPRSFLTAAVVDGVCYAIGGRLTFGTSGYTSVEAFDPDTGNWSPRASMPTGRFALSSAVIDGKIYVVGGASNNATVLSVAEVYNPVSNSWASLPPMPNNRAVFAAASAAGKLYVFGGTNNPGQQDYKSVAVFNPATNSWGSAAPMPLARTGAAAITIGDLIYVVGGGVTRNAANNVQIYDTFTDSWSAGPDLLANRVRHAVAYHDGVLYTIGGARRVTPPHPGTNSVEALVISNNEPLFQIVSGLNDAWFNPLTPGQGFFISVFPDSGTIFLAWFTYDTIRPAGNVAALLGEPGHRWLTAFGPYADNEAILDIEVTSGGVFDSASPSPSQELDGTITLEFQDCNSATLIYDIPSLGLKGAIEIQRIALDNVPGCEEMQP